MLVVLVVIKWIIVWLVMKLVTLLMLGREIVSVIHNTIWRQRVPVNVVMEWSLVVMCARVLLLVPGATKKIHIFSTTKIYVSAQRDITRWTVNVSSAEELLMDAFNVQTAQSALFVIWAITSRAIPQTDNAAANQGTNYLVAGTVDTCVECSESINNCDTCSNATYCNECDEGYTENSASVSERNCTPCIISLVGCSAC